jgi:hypothetical protein
VSGLFAFVQLEFGFLLGPPDGRYLLRRAPDADPEHVLVLRTLGAPERWRLRGRRARPVEEAEPAPVPTSRATLVRAAPFESRVRAEEWLARVRADGDASAEEVLGGCRELNAVLHAHRIAAADPHARDVGPAQALLARVGFGEGEQVADGRYAAALELSGGRAGVGPRRRAKALAPEERFAALLGGRERGWACEELVLRARSDLDAGRYREAALQARVALESLLAELEEASERPGRRAELEADRRAIGEAANAALHGEPPPELEETVIACVARMEAALRSRMAPGSSRRAPGA